MKIKKSFLIYNYNNRLKRGNFIMFHDNQLNKILPPEVLFNIYKYLSPEEIKAVFITNKSWYEEHKNAYEMWEAKC